MKIVPHDDAENSNLNLARGTASIIPLWGRGEAILRIIFRAVLDSRKAEMDLWEAVQTARASKMVNQNVYSMLQISWSSCSGGTRLTTISLSSMHIKYIRFGLLHDGSKRDYFSIAQLSGKAKSLEGKQLIFLLLILHVYLKLLFRVKHFCQVQYWISSSLQVSFSNLRSARNLRSKWIKGHCFTTYVYKDTWSSVRIEGKKNKGIF